MENLNCSRVLLIFEWRQIDTLIESDISQTSGQLDLSDYNELRAWVAVRPFRIIGTMVEITIYKCAIIVD